MIAGDDDLSAQLLAVLAARGVANSGSLQAALRRSQPTVSRLLAGAASQLLVLGAGRSTRYALPKSILGQSAQQPLFAVHEDGRIVPWGRLSFISGQRVHVQAQGVDVLLQGRLPWFLAPLRAEGYIGRQQARALREWGLPANPEQWTLEQSLFAALRTRDAPGALVLGDGLDADGPSVPPTDAADWDTLADATAASGPAGSSAGGEQAKFLTHSGHDGSALLVKFSPPRHTPFGARWHDLLHAEALALMVLKAHGVSVAECTVFETARRSFLASKRFDRHGPQGRSHVVPLHAVHDAFVPGPRQHWAATCEALARQRRLPTDAANQARALLHFGRLIGNNDMHFGNLSLHVALPDLAAGRFSLAPVYDMLPMRWRPDSHSGELGLLPFTPEPIDLQSAAQPVAAEFWHRAAQTAALSAEFRALAAEMARRVAA